MNNYHLRKKVFCLRLKGETISEISRKLKIRRATVSKWCKNFAFPDQERILKQANLNAQKKFRAWIDRNRERKQKHLQKIIKNVTRKIGKITKRELFLMGLMLYWAEGFKSKAEHRLGFCNSDPKMIKFYIKWLKHSFHITTDDLICRLTLNYSYKNLTEEVQKFWSSTLEIHLMQFTKPFYQNVKWQKEYLNKNHYHGVLRIHLKQSSNLLKQVLVAKDLIANFD